MATVSVGIPIRALNFDESGASTYYTVPAGRIAVVRFYQANLSAGGNTLSVGDFTFSNLYSNGNFETITEFNCTGVAIDPGNSQSAVLSLGPIEVVLDESKSVVSSNSGTSAVFSVIEYPKP